jgi:putative SOS response-associated peptidase YedK
VCGRFTLTIAERRVVADMLGADSDSIPEDYRPRYNIAPTNPHLIVTSKNEKRCVTVAQLGLVNSWPRDNSRAAACINTKAETIDTREHFASCIGDVWCLPIDSMNRPGRRRRAADMVSLP